VPFLTDTATGSTRAIRSCPVGRDDWFRGTAWDPPTREMFELKLGRARQTSRAQYLRIKGVGLTGASTLGVREAGRDLLRRVLDGYPDDRVQVTLASADLGDSLLRDGDLEEAADCFRRSMAGLGNVHCGAELGLAETILLAGWSERYDEAATALASSPASSNPFPAWRFRWHLAAARLARRQGDAAEASKHASEALGCIAEDHSPFPRHRNLGLVSTDEGTVNELHDLRGTA
jgi:hypothetical protein